MSSNTPRSVVVTGGLAGIGAAISGALSDAGWTVVALSLQGPDAEQPPITDVRVTPCIGDVRNSADLDRAATLAQSLAPLRGWVNNAAIVENVALHEASDEHISDVISTNLMGVICGTRTALQHYLAQGIPGSIVNISSIHGRGAFPGNPIYDASKGGVEAITRYAAVEYGHLGIRVNAVAPGAILTELLERVISSAPDPAIAQEDFASLNVARRLGKPREVADVVAYLMSESASFVNGAIVPVDSGAGARVYPFPHHPSVPAALPSQNGEVG